MSFAFWMKPDPIDFDTFDVILGATSSFATWTNGFGFYFNSSTSVRFWMNAYTTDFINGSFPSRLQWTHVVGNYDETLGSQNMKLYINGELAGTHNYTGGLDTQTVTYTIGELGNSGHSSTYYYQGLIEDPAIWSRTLSANEVAEIYSNGLGGFNLLSSGTYYVPTDLELWYDFDNTVSLDTFPFIKDRSSNGENGFYVFAPVNQFDVLVSGTPVDNNVSMDTTGLAYYYTDTGTNGVPVSGTGSFSIMAVVKNANTAFNAVVGAWNSGQTGTEGSFRITKTNATYSHVTDWAITNSSETAKYGNFNSGTDLTDTVWYNWVFTYDAVSGRCSGYENGVLVSQQILPGTRKSWTEFLVGARRYADTISNQWVGNIDTVAVWDKELQQGEIDEIYNNNESEVRLDKLNNSSNLRAWYRLGESGDTTSVMHDRSGNGYHLALQGGSATIVAVTPN